MFLIKRCALAADRLARGMTAEFGTWTPTAALIVAFTWWLTDYAWPVAALGAVAVTTVRMTVDRRIEQRQSTPETPQAHAVALAEASRD